MPRIRLKPNSPEFADAEAPRAASRQCEMPACPGHGEHRAPRSRDAGGKADDYYLFCIEHVREYNQAWNYFNGMSDSEVENRIVSSLYGERPTWRYDGAGMHEELRMKANAYRLGLDEDLAASRARDEARRSRMAQNTPEGDALAVLGLAPPVTLDVIKARYKALVKQHHPDLNPGDREAGELLKTINMAYTILKVAYESFRTLPDSV